MLDQHGYLHIMTRMDDVINTAGHRISTGRLEEVVNEHDSVVESAVVGYDDALKGETPLAFVILKGSAGCENLSQEQKDVLAKEINLKIRADVGAFASLKGVLFLNKLPKTRSGKILRGTIRKICNAQPYNFPATIDDATTLDTISQLCEDFKIRIGVLPPRQTNSAGPKDGETPVKEEAKTSTSQVKEVSPLKGASPVKEPSPVKVASPVKVPSHIKEQQPAMTPEELKALKKERAAKRKAAADALFEPRVLRTRKPKEEPAKKVGEKRPSPVTETKEEEDANKIQRTTD